MRELEEEVGLRVGAGELTAVAFTSGYAEFSWASGVFRDDFFLCRVDGHEVDAGGRTELERSLHMGHRWWTVGELATTSETVFPFRLAELVGELVAGRVPGEPVELPWHH